MSFKVKSIVVLDLDGTVRRSKTQKFIKNADDLELIPGIVTAVKTLISRGFLIYGLSNQGGVAFGHKTAEIVMEENIRTMELFRDDPNILYKSNYPFELIVNAYSMEGATNDIFNRRSLLRKPEIGGLGAIEYHALQNKVLIDWESSFMVGDRPEDQQCADDAGIDFIDAEEFLERFSKENKKPE